MKVRNSLSKLGGHVDTDHALDGVKKNCELEETSYTVSSTAFGFHQSKKFAIAAPQKDVSNTKCTRFDWQRTCP